MAEFYLQYAVKLSNTLVYVCLLSVGIYFIYQGNVVQRFYQKKTNFAEYTEAIIEMPTITAVLYPNSNRQVHNLTMGTDFDIFYYYTDEEVGTKRKKKLSRGKMIVVQE